MSRYVRNVVIEMDHDGDHVKVVVKPIKFVDLLALQNKGPDGDVAVLAEFAKMLPRYLVSIEGATDSEGNGVKVEDLEDAFWIPVVAEVMMRMVDAATPSNPT